MVRAIPMQYWHRTIQQIEPRLFEMPIPIRTLAPEFILIGIYPLLANWGCVTITGDGSILWWGLLIALQILTTGVLLSSAQQLCGMRILMEAIQAQALAKPVPAE